MKTETSLRKTPVEPLAVMPDARLAGIPAHATAHARLKEIARARPRAATYPDIPPSVYSTLIGCWTALLAVFWLTFAESPNAAFMVAVSTAFAVMFFGVPIVLNRIGYRRPLSGPSLGAFLRGSVQTIYGPVNGVDALVQVIVVPACLTIGAILISFIVNLDRMAN
jgi:hypothetical protein